MLPQNGKWTLTEKDTDVNTLGPPTHPHACAHKYTLVNMYRHTHTHWWGAHTQTGRHEKSFEKKNSHLSPPLIPIMFCPRFIWKIPWSYWHCARVLPHACKDVTSVSGSPRPRRPPLACFPTVWSLGLLAVSWTSPDPFALHESPSQLPSLC